MDLLIMQFLRDVLNLMNNGAVHRVVQISFNRSRLGRLRQHIHRHDQMTSQY